MDDSLLSSGNVFSRKYFERSPVHYVSERENRESGARKEQRPFFRRGKNG